MEKNQDPFKNALNTSEQLMNSVTRAVESGDFSHLLSDISGNLNSAGKDFSRQSYQDDFQKNSENQSSYQQPESSGDHTDWRSGTGTSDTGTATAGEERKRAGRRVRSVDDIPEMINKVIYGDTSFFNQKSISKNRGIVSLVLGIVGTVLFGPPALGLFFSMFTGNSASDVVAFGVGSLVLAAITGINIWLILRGKKEQELAKAYYRYGAVVGMHELYDVGQLSELVGESAQTTAANLRAMIDKGFFKKAYLSHDDQTLFLTENAYDRYLKAYARQRQEKFENDQVDEQARKAAQERVQNEMNNAKKAEDDSGLPEEVREILQQGSKYIDFVRQAGMQISDETMKRKLFRLEQIMTRIFEAVRKHPEATSGLRRFMDYYLPTTDKLLRAYLDMQNQPSGPTVEKTKQDITEAMDTIINAYERLLDSLFEDMSWDVASDISVMETMMRQDGLTGEDIRQTKVDTHSDQNVGAYTDKTAGSRTNPKIDLTFGTGTDTKNEVKTRG